MPSPPPTTRHRNSSGSIAPAYFEQLYRDKADPWDYSGSDYEARKYAATLDALPRDYYRSAVELGCSIGVLTCQLAHRADALVALDVSPEALARAALRCQRLGHVAFERRTLPDGMPTGPFDLAVLSEVGYYLSMPDLEVLADRLAGALEVGGHLVLVHWTGETDYPLTADAVHGRFLSDSRWRPLEDERTANYRLDVLERR